MQSLKVFLSIGRSGSALYNFHGSNSFIIAWYDKMTVLQCFNIFAFHAYLDAVFISVELLVNIKHQKYLKLVKIIQNL